MLPWLSAKLASAEDAENGTPPLEQYEDYAPPLAEMTSYAPAEAGAGLAAPGGKVPAKQARKQPPRAAPRGGKTQARGRRRGGGRAIGPLPTPTGLKKRCRNGVRSLQDIRRLQSRTELIIPQEPLSRLVREVAEETRPGLRFQEQALEAVHEAAESYLVDMFRAARTIMLHDRGRLTLMKKDLDALAVVTALGWKPLGGGPED